MSLEYCAAGDFVLNLATDKIPNTPFCNVFCRVNNNSSILNLQHERHIRKEILLFWLLNSIFCIYLNKGFLSKYL